MDRLQLVMFHGSCNDGFCAAWLWWKFVNPKAEFKAVQYGDTQGLEDFVDRDVVILDFSFKRDFLLKAKEIAKTILVLDHHETAQTELEGLDFCNFDMTKSGARLTWEYICQCIKPNFNPLNVPFLVDYTEDRDLWLWKLNKSKEVSAAIFSYPRSFKVWDKFELESLQIEGTALMRLTDLTVKRVSRQPKFAVLAGHRVPVVNTTGYISEIGNALCKGYAFALTFFVKNENEIVYSLRSDENGENVADIAKLFGGGGHPHAAGFTANFITPMADE